MLSFICLIFTSRAGRSCYQIRLYALSPKKLSWLSSMIQDKKIKLFLKVGLAHFNISKLDCFYLTSVDWVLRWVFLTPAFILHYAKHIVHEKKWELINYDEIAQKIIYTKVVENNNMAARVFFTYRIRSCGPATTASTSEEILKRCEFLHMSWQHEWRHVGYIVKTFHHF